MPDRTEAEIAAELAEVDSAIVAKESGETVVTAADPAEAEAEVEASRKGWVPKAHFKGDPTKWKPASIYLEAGRRFEKNTQRELQDLRTKYAELEKTGQAFAKYHEEAMARKDSEIAAAIKDAKARARQAVRDGDDDLAETLDERVELLQQERAGIKAQVKEVTKEEAATGASASESAQLLVVREWTADGNEWFDSDPELRQYAIDVGQQLKASGETIFGRAFLDKVAERVRADFPRRFSKKTVERRNDQVEGGASAGSTSGHTIHDLPATDLALMKEFIAKGWTTKEKFLKNYLSDAKKIHRTS